MRSFFNNSDSFGPIKATLIETRLMRILIRIFEVNSQDEEFYFLKLEALWLLISLSMVDGEESKLLLLSDYATAHGTNHMTNFSLTEAS